MEQESDLQVMGKKFFQINHETLAFD